MDWYKTIFEVIDMRSFSNLWFWLALAVLWSTTSHFVVGVPHDMIRRAAREGGQAMADVESLAHIYTRRLLFISRVGGAFAVAFLAFLTTGLLVLATAYAVEFAQALLCLLIPMQIVGAMTLRTCLMIEQGDLGGDDLLRRLRVHRMSIQTVGMFSLFFTGMFGMYQNLTLGVFG
ncbi:MAG: component of SufBCD complex [Rhodobacter sp. CACIA14H1]|nr:MAG: component of SufBCD complex [Rhodobacter sp. CACIA14H1]